MMFLALQADKGLTFRILWILAILISYQLQFAIGATIHSSESISTSSSEESKEALNVTSNSIVENMEKQLESLSSDKEETIKVEHKSLTSTSEEKLGTSSTIPIAYATTNGIIYDAPLNSGLYTGFGGQSATFIVPAYQGQGVIGSAVHHGGQGQILTAGHGLVTGHHSVGHGPSFGLVQGPVGGYGGVVYGGHGNSHNYGHGVGQDHITINKQSEIGVGPYGEGHIGDTVQKSINHVGTGSIGHPYSPYGHGGVVYMGNGLIPEHIAGVKQVGQVLPPPGYQQQHLAINKQTALGPYGDVHNGVTVKGSVNSIGLNGGLVDVGFGQSVHQQFQPKDDTFGPHGYDGGLSHGGGLPHLHHQQVSINRHSEVDGFGNVQKGVNVQKEFNNGPGLGYNGLSNYPIAHTDQAILGRGHSPAYYNGRSFSNPDPYFNNQIDPLYRIERLGHAMTLLTTGPNRYYQGKNPVGLYERFHRFG